MILEVEDLHKSFGKSKVLNGINLSIERGEKRAIIGPNGAGKSTLFNVITGMYSPTSGKIRYEGENIAGLSPFKISRKGLSRSFQIINIFGDMTAYESIRSAVLAKNKIYFDFKTNLNKMKEIESQTLDIIEEIGLSELRDVPSSEMAYGSQRALEIGLSIATNPTMLMLDEPGAGLSIDETKKIIELIRNITEEKTLMIVEHDMDVVFALADRISVLYYGEIIITDVPEKVRENKTVREIYLGEANDSE